MALAGILGRSPARADDAWKPNDKKCNKDKQCQSGYCDRTNVAKHGTYQERCVGDCTPPTCTVQLISGPPALAIFTVQDTSSGLASIAASVALQQCPEAHCASILHLLPSS